MKKKDKTAKAQEKKNVGLLDIIKYPIVTEKTTHLSAHNQVVFAVCRHASKPEIKAAIEQVFGVSVKAINTLIRKGKQKKFKGRTGTQEDVKRAMVTLNEGQQLDLGSGI